MAEPTDDEIATQQAAGGAHGTTEVPADPAVPVVVAEPPAPAPFVPTTSNTDRVNRVLGNTQSAPTYPATDIDLRQWFRTNIEWVIKEMDLHGMGATPEQREISNPVDPNP
jgi:hypothetical protein